MGRHCCVAALFLVCLMQLVKSYPVTQKIDRRTENGENDLHTRIARHARWWNAASNRKHGSRRHHKSMKASKAENHYLGRDVVKQDEFESKVDEQPGKWNIWRGNDQQNEDHDWAGHRKNRQHWGRGNGRRSSQGQRKRKRNNRLKSNYNGKHTEKTWVDNVPGGDHRESDISAKGDYRTNWWNNVQANDEDKIELWGYDETNANWLENIRGRNNKKLDESDKDKRQRSWWKELWGCDEKESDKGKDETNSWRDDKEDYHWWDNLWGRGDKESDVSDKGDDQTDWWSDIWVNSKEDDEWKENENEFSWWNHLWNPGDEDSDMLDGGGNHKDWWNYLWETDEDDSDWLHNDWWDDLLNHDGKESNELDIDNKHTDWWNDLWEPDDHEHDWWKDWWKDDDKETDSDSDWWDDFWDHRLTDKDDSQAGWKNDDDEHDWWTDWWQSVENNIDSGDVWSDELWNHDKNESDTVEGQTGWWNWLCGNDVEGNNWWDNDKDGYGWWRHWFETGEQDIDSNGHWLIKNDTSAEEQDNILSGEESKETILMGDVGEYDEKETNWWKEWWGQLFGLNSDEDDMVGDLREHRHGKHETHGNPEEQFVLDVFSGFISALVNIFCGEFSGELQTNVAPDFSVNPNGSPVMKPNNVINGNTINKENTSTNTGLNHDRFPVQQASTTNNPYKEVTGVIPDDVDGDRNNSVDGKDYIVDYNSVDDDSDKGKNTNINESKEFEDTHSDWIDESNFDDSGHRESEEIGDMHSGGVDEINFGDNVHEESDFTKYEDSEETNDQKPDDSHKTAPGFTGYGKPAGVNQVSTDHQIKEDRHNFASRSSASTSEEGQGR